MSDETSNPEMGEDAIDVSEYAKSLLPTEPDEGQPEPEAEAGEAAEETTSVEAESGDDSEAEDVYLVKVNGEEIEVPFDELLSGYSRQSDYQRKTQELADQRRALESERGQVEAWAKSQVEAAHNRMQETLQKFALADAQEPDWVKLAEDDPLGYAQERAKWDVQQKRRDEARAVLEQQHEFEQQRRIAQEREKLVDAIPEWRDPKTYRTESSELSQIAAEVYGYTPQELSQVVDHRALKVLRDAAAYRKSQGQQPSVEKRVAASPKRVLKPGAAKSKTGAAERSRQAAERVKATGSLESLAAWMLTK